jgi:hypothetical protein
MDRSQPDRWLTLVLALVVLALSVVVLWSIAADVLPEHPLLARALLYTASVDILLTWAVALSVMLLLIGILLVVARNDALLR